MRSFYRPAALLVALLAFFALTLTSCEREPGSGPNGEGIHGNVEIYNAYGEEQDPTNVTVTIAQTGRTTKTDSEGAYWLPYLESGNYTLQFTKPGQAATFIDVAHTRTKHTSTAAPIAKMIEPSPYYVTQTAAELNTDDSFNPYFKISGKLNKAVPAGKEIKVKLYLGSNPDVSLADYVHTFEYKVTAQEFTIRYPYFASLLINNEMERGDTVYMVMYTDTIMEDTCDGPWNKPICSNSTTINTTNPIIFTGQIPQL